MKYPIKNALVALLCFLSINLTAIPTPPHSLLAKHIQHHGLSQRADDYGTAKHSIIPTQELDSPETDAPAQEEGLSLTNTILSPEWIAYDCALNLVAGASPSRPIVSMASAALDAYAPGLGATATATLGALAMTYSLCKPEKRARLMAWCKKLFSPTALATEAAASCLVNVNYNTESPLHWATYLDSSNTLSNNIATAAITFAAISNPSNLAQNVAWSTTGKCLNIQMSRWLSALQVKWWQLKNTLFGAPIPGSAEFEQYGLVRNELTTWSDTFKNVWNNLSNTNNDGMQNFLLNYGASAASNSSSNNNFPVEIAALMPGSDEFEQYGLATTPAI